MTSPHALLLPYPAQGHVIPFMALAHNLVDRGFKITFVNTEFNHDRVVAVLSDTKVSDDIRDDIHLVSIPDGMGPGEDRNDFARLCEGILRVMPYSLEELIRNINKTNENKITCFVADVAMPWSFEVANKMGLRSAAFWTACAGTLAMTLSIPKLIEDGIIDEDGTVKRSGMIKLSPDMPETDPAHFVWNCLHDLRTQQICFNYMTKDLPAIDKAEFIICNSFYELEQPVFAHAPNILPLGPLHTENRVENSMAHFWADDTTCTAWLDRQPSNSVIYVAFGSITIFDQRQFRELALGLELTGRRFLWVVRPDLTDAASDAYPVGFRERIVGRGLIVGWSPQQKVLAHPSVACFVSHCGWNSTMEGLRNGVPILCWPYFGDQIFNQAYICDIWKNGLKMVADESGLISGKHIKSKVEEVLGDEEIRKRALELKEMASRSIHKGGSSFQNFNSFVDSMKEL